MIIGNYKFFFKTKYNEKKFYIVDSKISNKFSIYYDSVGKYLKIIRKGKQTVYYFTHNKINKSIWTNLYYDGKTISTTFYK